MVIHKRVKDSHKAPKRTLKFRRSRIAISYPLLEAKRKWPGRFAGCVTPVPSSVLS